jgi:hypothetical protein
LYAFREWQCLDDEDRMKMKRFAEVRGAGRLLSFAPQAWAFYFTRSVLRPTRPDGVTESPACDMPSETESRGDCHTFPKSFPLCDQRFPRTFDSAGKVRSWYFQPAKSPAYEHWLSDNKGLADAWYDPSFRDLRRCPDSAMRHIFRKQWVSLAELADSEDAR